MRLITSNGEVVLADEGAVFVGDWVSAYPPGIMGAPAFLMADDKGAHVFHAIFVEADKWHATTPDHTGIIVLDNQQLVTMMADVVAESMVANITSPGHYLTLDGLYNTWINDQYMSPDKYLPTLVYELAMSMIMPNNVR